MEKRHPAHPECFLSTKMTGRVRRVDKDTACELPVRRACVHRGADGSSRECCAGRTRRQATPGLFKWTRHARVGGWVGGWGGRVGCGGRGCAVGDDRVSGGGSGLLRYHAESRPGRGVICPRQCSDAAGDVEVRAQTPRPCSDAVGDAEERVSRPEERRLPAARLAHSEHRRAQSLRLRVHA